MFTLLLMNFLTFTLTHAGGFATLKGELGSFDQKEIQLIRGKQVFYIDRSKISGVQNKNLDRPGKKVTLEIPLIAIRQVKPNR